MMQYAGMAKPTKDRTARPIRIAAISLCLLLALLPSPLLGQGRHAAVSFSTGTSAGLLFGQASEYVYNQALAADYKNSELIWPFEPLAYAGASLAVDSNFGLFAKLGLKQGFAGKTGRMTDSDFLNGDGQRTHFSQSDCYTERATLLDLSFGYDFSPLNLAQAGRLRPFFLHGLQVVLP